MRTAALVVLSVAVLILYVVVGHDHLKLIKVRDKQRFQEESIGKLEEAAGVMPLAKMKQWPPPDK
jgi:hypothetical protein